MHISCLQAKPFNPILGETYQCKINGLDIYLEHIEHKPPTYSFYCKSKNYMIYGHQTIEANTGANSVKAFKKGKYIVRFADGHEFDLQPPSIIVNGVSMGKRTFNFRRCTTVIDKVGLII